MVGEHDLGGSDGSISGVGWDSIRPPDLVEFYGRVLGSATC